MPDTSSAMGTARHTGAHRWLHGLVAQIPQSSVLCLQTHFLFLSCKPGETQALKARQSPYLFFTAMGQIVISQKPLDGMI